MLADMDERRKKLKEDFESFDITSGIEPIYLKIIFNDFIY
jgi:hypothetical protein